MCSSLTPTFLESIGINQLNPIARGYGYARAGTVVGAKRQVKQGLIGLHVS
ncbi:MAG: hypothetical protein PHU36_01110 [Syntrophomonadaceae bacterium]|nr:hypothetical protein [Syntrophomonadaceae bacterium]